MTYRTEFPDFPAADMPEIPFGFDDMSWRNDACPRFDSEALGLTLWIDFKDPAQREIEHGGKRFTLVIGDEPEAIEESDDMADILAAIDDHCVSHCGGHTDTGRGICAHCAKIMI